MRSVWQILRQGWACETGFAASVPLDALRTAAEAAALVVLVLARDQAFKPSEEGGGSHAHLEQLIWHLMGRKKVRLR